MTLDPNSFSPLMDLAGAGGPTSNLERANFVEAEVVACMRMKGRVYESVPALDTSRPGRNTPEGALAYARSYGYGLLHLEPAQDTIKATSDAQDARSLRINSLPDLDRKAVVTDKTGCTATAEESANRYFPEKNTAIREAIGKEIASEGSQPEITSATKAWAACMSSRGYDAETPSDVRKPFSDAVTDHSLIPALFPTETVVATDAAECSQDTIWPATKRYETAAVARLQAQFGTEPLCGANCAPKAD